MTRKPETKEEVEAIVEDGLARFEKFAKAYERGCGMSFQDLRNDLKQSGYELGVVCPYGHEPFICVRPIEKR